MDRNQAKEFYPILQAFAEGRAIECRTKPSLIEGSDVPNDWTEMKEIGFWNNIEYRIKPEPKYRQFKDSEECWNEMQKHQPFGWIKDRDGDKTFIGSINSDNSIFTCSSEILFLKELFEDFTFIDGTPFGIKEEEQLWHVQDIVVKNLCSSISRIEELAKNVFHFDENDIFEHEWIDDKYCGCINLPKGSIKKLIGKDLSWSDKPIELKE